MTFLGLILVFISSFFSAWGAHYHNKNGFMEKPKLLMNPMAELAVAAGSALGALLGVIALVIGNGFVAGIIGFIAFQILAAFWTSILFK